jgi:hypothetical protein
MYEINQLATVPCTTGKIDIPAVGCVKTNYLVYGGVGVVLVYLLTKKT